MQQEGVQEFFPDLAIDSRTRARRKPIAVSAMLRRRLTPANGALAAISALSLFLGLYQISNEGYANDYYAAAVQSMLQNWHAFFFASFDSKGFVTVDKPPAGLWIQTASAWLFGFHGWSILLPQALASVGSVSLVYRLTRGAFGQAAGLIAALALAIAPINVAVARNNTSDGLLIFTLLLGAACLTKATRQGSLRWLTAAMVFTGIGFNIKMMEAYLVLPAFVAMYLLSTSVSFWRRVLHLAIAAVALLAVSFSWATIVALTPASERPFIGSTQDNNIFSLIFGYNGINRLLPKGWSIFGITNSSSAALGGAGGGGGVGGVSENGAQGVFRLLDTQLAGQIGWLIPLALVGLIVAWGRPRFRKLSNEQLMLVLFGGWAAVEIVFFSVAGFYHRYYLSTLSPAIAVLAGAGIVALWRLFRGGGWRAGFFPLAIILAAASQYRILGDYPAWRHWLGPVMIGGAAVTTAVFVVYSLLTRRSGFSDGRGAAVLRVVAAAGIVVLFAAPASWSYVTAANGNGGTLPVAGPSATSTNGGIGGGGAPGGASFGAQIGGGSTSTNAALIAYLEANKGSASYLVAVTSSQEADSIIISTGQAVMSMGGFSGNDPILTVDSLKALISSGEIRFFETSGRSIGGQNTGGADGGRGGDFEPGDPPEGFTGSTTRENAPATDANASGPEQSPASAAGTSSTTTITSWIQSNCTAVSSTEIAAASSGSTSAAVSANGLYDCQGAATSS